METLEHLEASTLGWLTMETFERLEVSTIGMHRSPDFREWIFPLAYRNEPSNHYIERPFLRSLLS